MKVPIHEWMLSADRPSHDYDGRERADWYKMALWNCLLEFKPKKCLEIGTNFFGTARVFQRYFDWHQPTGSLVTCDIVALPPKHMHGDMRKITQVIVKAGDAVETRRRIECADIGFDFAFIDGDHSYAAASQDYKMCRDMNIPVMLFDDCRGQCEGPTQLLNELEGACDICDFSDWPVWVGVKAVRV